MLKKLMLVLIILGGMSMGILAQEIPEGFRKVKDLGGIEEYLLTSNQLCVLLMEDHAVPVLTFMVTYRVGSRNEVTGTTGATHLLEHLMFKGTPTFNKESGTQIAATLQNIGAIMNASTWMDRTNYFENIPSDHLELVIHLESDRMRNSRLREEDRQAEMTVVRNEFEQGENSPFQALDKVIWGTAFQAHPYRQSTIGWRSDIENVPIEKLREFYNTFYWPNNATISVIGDFDRTAALGLIKQYFGAISASPQDIPQVYTTEPKQEGARRVIVKRAGQVAVVGIAHKVPEGSHPDTYALYVLSKILTEGKTSRFYKALTDQGKAVNLFCFYFPLRDPGLFIPYVFLTPGTTPEEVEQVTLAEYERIKNEGVSEAELKRAINQITAETAYERDGSYSIASQLNEAIAMGDWTFYVTFLDSIRRVTAQEVQEVVKKYFLDEHSTTGYFIPLTGGENDQSTAKSGAWKLSDPFQYYRRPGMGEAAPSFVAPANKLDPEYQPLPGAAAVSLPKMQRKKVAGIDLITVKTGVKDVITFTGSFAAGDVLSPENNTVIADLTGHMLDKGTTKQGKFQLAEQLETLGAEINFRVGEHTLSFNGKCLRKDIETVIDLLAEQLRYPAFDEQELEKLKKQRQGSFKRQLENTGIRAEHAMDRTIFPAGHPNHLPSLEKLIEDTEKVTVEDIRQFHRKYYGPRSMVFVTVGDLDARTIEGAIKKAFAGWQGGIDYPEYEKAPLLQGSAQEIVKMEQKTSATVRIGQPTRLKRSDPDYLPFMVGNYILGGNFSARLMSIIRDDEGLTYGINSAHDSDIFCDGQWYVEGDFAPELLQKGIESTRREIKRWVKEGITAEELKNKKTTLIGSFKVQLATTGGLASQILSFVQRGYDIDYLQQFPKDVETLTVEQINTAIRKYVDPENLVMVIAGSVNEDGSPLKAEKN